MQFVDTHTHLFVQEFKTDIDEVVNAAIDLGVTKFFLPHIDAKTTENFYSLCRSFPKNMFPLMGLHPSSVNENYVTSLNHIFKQFEIVEETIPQQKFFGVGEIGIDLYWDKTYLKQQQDAFEQQLLFAKSKNLPIIIHARESFNEIFEIVDRHADDNLRGIFHCFTGNPQQAEHIMAYKTFKMGIGGVITYKNSTLPEVLQLVSLDFLVLETDAPYLSPVPYRGKRNQSSYIPIIAQKLSDVKQVPLSLVAEKTTHNAQQIFNW